MNKVPIVSVLLSVYNGEKYLRESIESILDQTFTDFEFIIINDGSTDASQRIISAYHDPRIRIINNSSNVGLTKSLNRGLKLARGIYVARQDADDISEPQRLAKQVKFMNNNPDIVLLGTWYREIDAEGNFGDNVRLPSDQTELQWALLFYCPFVHSGVMFPRDTFLKKVGYYNEDFHYAMDHELWLRASRQQPITNFREYLVRYRQNPYSMTETFGELANEGAWLTTGFVGELLNWAENNWVCNEIQFNKMFKLLYGGKVDLSLSEIDQTSDTIWQLHQSFSRIYNLTPSVSSRHFKKLQIWMSKRYIRIGLGCIERSCYPDAKQLYSKAIRLHNPTFLMPKSARLLYKLLIIKPKKII